MFTNKHNVWGPHPVNSTSIKLGDSSQFNPRISLRVRDILRRSRRHIMNHSQAGSAEHVVTEGLGLRPMKPQIKRHGGHHGWHHRHGIFQQHWWD
jgi:hypothetical protein